MNIKETIAYGMFELNDEFEQERKDERFARTLYMVITLLALASFILWLL